MKSFVDKLKEIPIWSIAIVLIVGTVAAAGLWILSIEAPVTYEEPITIEYSDEMRYDEWEIITEFPHIAETEPKDLTYRTFHDYFRVNYEGRRPVHINATFSADLRGDIEPEHVGFVVLEGIVHPEEVTWEDNLVIHEGREVELRWGFQEENITLEKDDAQNYTIINVLSNDVPLNSDNNDIRILWEFRRGDVEPTPVDVEVPTPLPGVYNITPILVVVSVMITVIISYVLFKGEGDR